MFMNHKAKIFLVKKRMEHSRTNIVVVRAHVCVCLHVCACVSTCLCVFVRVTVYVCDSMFVFCVKLPLFSFQL